MGNIVENLNQINIIKEEIKTSIVNKGGDLTGKHFADYPEAIDNLPSGGGGIEEVSTEAAMDAKVAPENDGKYYKYTGSGTKYKNGDIYLVIGNSYAVDLNSQWRAATVTNPDASLYEMYESNSNYHVANGYACMKVTISGYTNFSIYINSYAESSFDYTIAFNLDVAKPTSLPSSSTSGVKAHTSGKQYNPSGSVSSNYTKVDYTCDGGEHFFWIVYRKDGSADSNNDRGYILIPKNQ